VPALAERRTALAAVAALAALGAVLRLHFLDVPLNTDEAGFAQVARLWSEGHRLYGDTAWVDRPQGLLVLYRGALAFGADEAVRVLAIIAAVVATVAVAAAAWALSGPRAAVLGAGLYAVLSPAPHLEGFTANGELLGSAFAAGGVALGAWWLVRGDGRLLVLAGLVACLGPLVKQSALDAALALVALVLLEAWRRRDWRSAVGGLLRLAAGAAIPLALVLAQAAATGIGDWWFAVVGYRTGTESAISGDTGLRLTLLWESTHAALGDLAPLLLAVPGAVALHRARRLTLPALWLGAAAFGFLAGGLFHDHYWVQMIAPLSVCAAAGLDWLVQRRGALVAAAVVALLAVPVVLRSAEVYWEQDARKVSLLTSEDPRILSAIDVGRFMQAQTDPDDRVYALWANAALSWHAHRPSAYRYLWYRGVEFIPGAREDVRRLFTGPDPPAMVAVYQPPRALDQSGTVERALEERYDLVAELDGTPVYRLRR
jgi:4-amino-4-deoxy-L-arabinose transferase-like glycosyltransferase